METQQLHRGRLIDHIQLVVDDLAATRRFYEAIFKVLGVPIGGEAEDYFWADELFVSSATSRAAQGKTTGRHHLAFQARDRAMVEAVYKAALAYGGKDNGAPASGLIIPGITLPSCSIPPATISKRSITAKPSARRRA
jgi:catechol 2,3-dioxygenase-like lactoylglutathione lyase family enzyme